ncbi:hypothetical protein L3Q82_020991, partial [Scortum barcoo]
QDPPKCISGFLQCLREDAHPSGHLVVQEALLSTGVNKHLKREVLELKADSGLDLEVLPAEGLKEQSSAAQSDDSLSSAEEEDFFLSIKQTDQRAGNTKQLESYLASPTDTIDILKTFPSVCHLSLKLNTPLPASAASSSDPRCNTPRNRLQFAYQPGVGVEDAILYLLHRAHSHLDKGSGTVRILFLDFSSAFNTIQPTLLRDKLSRMGVDPQLMDWISDYLTGRPQLCYNSELCHIQKYADDTAIVGCIRDDREEEYRRLVGDFAAWCHTNHLQLNTSKTKELVIDFGRSRPRPRPVLLEGAEVEAVDSYRYLGLWIDNKLDWTTHTSHLYGKTQSRMYFLRRLRSFNICSKLLQMFYQSVVASCPLLHCGMLGGQHIQKGHIQTG